MRRAAPVCNSKIIVESFTFSIFTHRNVKQTNPNYSYHTNQPSKNSNCPSIKLKRYSDANAILPCTSQSKKAEYASSQTTASLSPSYPVSLISQSSPPPPPTSCQSLPPLPRQYRRAIRRATEAITENGEPRFIPQPPRHRPFLPPAPPPPVHVAHSPPLPTRYRRALQRATAARAVHSVRPQLAMIIR